MIIKLVWMYEMKKLCYVLFGVAFLTSNQDVYAKDIAVDTSQEAKNAIELEKNDLPSFIDLYSIMANKYVQDGVRVLQFNLLKLLRSIGLTTSEKEKAKKIRGNRNDIDQAKRRIDYLTSLESSLENANTLERVKNVLGLNLKGKESVKHALSVIRAVRETDSLKKVNDIPEINENVITEIEEYELFKEIVKNANSIEKLKNIPGLNTKAIKEIKKLENRAEKFEAVEDVKDIVSSSVINARIKEQVSDLLEMETKLKEADTLDQMRDVPNISTEFLASMDSQIKESEDQKNQIKEFKKTVANLNYRLENAISDAEKERRFCNSLIGAILRALIGFDYRNATYNFAQSKEKKVINGTALVAAAKNSISHMGGKEEDLFAITNGLQSVLKILITNKDWPKEIESIKKQLETVKAISEKFNDEAKIIQVNVEYAVYIASCFADGSRRPPRDNVDNFDNPNQKNQVVNDVKDSEESKQSTEVKQPEETKPLGNVDEQVSDGIDNPESAKQPTEEINQSGNVNEQAVVEGIKQPDKSQFLDENDQSENTEQASESDDVSQTEDTEQDSELSAEA